MKTVGVGGDDADSVSNSSFQTHRNMDIPVLRNLRLNPSGHWHGTSPNERCLMAWPDYPTKIAMRYLNFALFFFLSPNPLWLDRKELRYPLTPLQSMQNRSSHQSL